MAVSLFSDQSAASSASKLLGLSGRVSRPPSFGMPVDFARPASLLLGEKLIWASWGEENYQFVEITACTDFFVDRIQPVTRTKVCSAGTKKVFMTKLTGMKYNI